MPRRLLVVLAAGASALLVACGEQGIQLSKSDPNYAGAKIFEQRCSGCHTFSVAGTQGSASETNSREYKDGPSFDTRHVERDQVLYALQNGGYSSGPMPQDIAVGKEAEQVADFVAEFSGSGTAGE